MDLQQILQLLSGTGQGPQGPRPIPHIGPAPNGAHIGPQPPGALERLIAQLGAAGQPPAPQGQMQAPQMPPMMRPQAHIGPPPPSGMERLIAGLGAAGGAGFGAGPTPPPNPLSSAIAQRGFQAPGIPQNAGQQSGLGAASTVGMNRPSGIPQFNAPPPSGPQLTQERPTAQGLQGFDGYGQSAPLTPPPPQGPLGSTPIGPNATGLQAPLGPANSGALQAAQQQQNPVIAFLRALGHIR